MKVAGMRHMQEQSSVLSPTGYQRLSTVQPETLGRVVLVAEEPLKIIRERQPLEDMQLLLFAV
eukprot:44972-Eustigmatos_ZCMA.PRE.1